MMFVLSSAALPFVLSNTDSLPKRQCREINSSAKKARNSETVSQALKVDHFRKFGRVQHMDACIERCCDTENCDLAMMSYGGRNCYGVACFSENLCQMLPSYPTKLTFDVSHVIRGTQ